MPDLVVEPEEKQELEERRLGSMSLLQHLEELRKRIIYSVAAVAVCFGVGWYYADRIFAKMSVPISQALINHHYDPMLTVTRDRKSTRLNSSHANISYAVFCLKKKKTQSQTILDEHVEQQGVYE